MDLAAYFDRIGFRGVARPDLETLRALHRAHLLAIPYENLDVQLGEPLTPDPSAAFEKIVRRRRGGWCYEMNGVFAAALDAIGFRVTRLAGGVMREVMGDAQAGNHLVLLVHLDQPWIADVGFGDGSLDPFPLAPAAIHADGFDFRLEMIEGGWWRFHNHAQGGARSYDFRLEPAPAELLEAKCQWLQTAPESVFVQNALAQRWRPDALLQLRGRTLRRVRPSGVEQHRIASADEYVAVLADEFELDVPEAAALWPRICARHVELFGLAEA
jgi:N-hydroxyarylamine O-acetyltransferase